MIPLYSELLQTQFPNFSMDLKKIKKVWLNQASVFLMQNYTPSAIKFLVSNKEKAGDA